MICVYVCNYDNSIKVKVNRAYYTSLVTCRGYLVNASGRESPSLSVCLYVGGSDARWAKDSVRLKYLKINHCARTFKTIFFHCLPLNVRRFTV